MMFKERAIIYLRNSGDASRSALGKQQENHKRQCLEYVDYKDYELVDILAEDANKFTSGSDSELPEYKKLLALAERGLFDVLVSNNIERIARDEAKAYELKATLSMYGARIELVELPRFGEEGNELKDAVDIGYAAYERRRITSRLVKGQMDVVRNGKILKSSNPPYGYTFAFANGLDNRQGYVFEIVPAEAEIVKLISQLCLQGLGIQAIADYLNKLDYPPPKNGQKWRQSTVLYILKNVTYTGHWFYNKMSRVKTYDRDKRQIVKRWVKNPEDEQISAACPVIISEDIFKAVQAKLKSNRKLSKRNTRNEYLMSGRLVCYCGAAVCVHTSTIYAYYRCDARSRPKRHNHRCDLPTFTVKEVDTKVWDALGEFVNNPARLKEGMQDYQAQMAHLAGPLEIRLKIIDKLIADKEAEFEDAALNMRLAKGERAKSLFANDLDTIEKIMESLKSEHGKIIAKLETESITNQQITQTLDFAAMIREDWEEISKDFEAKKEFITMIDAKVTLLVVAGQRKGLLEAKLTAPPIELCFDTSVKPCPDGPDRPWPAPLLPAARQDHSDGKSTYPDNQRPAD
jgi:site-specific DNA recombinase